MAVELDGDKAMVSRSSTGTLHGLLRLPTLESLARCRRRVEVDHERCERIENQLLAEILDAARGLIREERHWCKGMLAIGKSGRCWPEESFVGRMPEWDADRFDIEGSIYWAAAQLNHAALAEKAIDVLRQLVGTAPYRWGDDPAIGHAQVLRLLEEAVERVLGRAR